MPRTNALIVAMLCLACVSGCDAFAKKKVVASQPGSTGPVVVPLARRDTVGQFATLSGAMNAKVSGYGLVIGLGDRGCTSVPPAIENYLKTELARMGVGWYSTGTGQLSPERIIRDKDTAVVLVVGMIPALAPAGTRFDLFVTALPQTETTTLAGGHLMDTRLFLTLDEMAMPTGGTPSIGRSDPYLGDLLVNPFLDSTKTQDLLKFRDGRIPNGGVVTKDMPVRLELREANYGMAVGIAAALNARFKEGFKPVADAQNNRVVDLRIPYRYRQDYVHFLELVLHMPISKGAGLWEAHAKALVQGMEAPNADYVNLSLVLEAMGPQILPIIKSGYTSRNQAAALYCAIAGMRLDDASAMPVIVYHATRKDSPLRMTAIRELSRYPREMDAKVTLENLLDDPNDTIRIAAYEALVKVGHSTRIQRVDITNVDNRAMFTVDVVQTRGNCIVYGTQTGEPRLALFGADIPMSKYLFFRAPDDLVTVQVLDPRPGVRLPILGANDPTVRATRLTMTTMPTSVSSVGVTTQPTSQPAVELVSPKFKGPMLLVDRLIYRTRRHSDQYQVPFDVKSLIQALGTSADKDVYGQVRGLGLTYGQVIEVLYRMCKQGDIRASFVLQDLPEMQRMTDNASTTERPDMPGQ